jgi:GNAT superfamily N-acetyltransferase
MIKSVDILHENVATDMAHHLESTLLSKFPQIDKLDIYAQQNNLLYLSDLYIKPEFRGQGIGSKIMKYITDFADSNNLTVVLIPEPESLKKSAVKRLVNFYKRFGFVINTGKNKDYELSEPFATNMYRYPKIK